MPTPISNELLSESCKSQKYKESLFDKKATVERTGRATCTLTCSFGLTDVPGAGWEMITFCPNASVARMKTRTVWRSFDIIVFKVGEIAILKTRKGDWGPFYTVVFRHRELWCTHSSIPVHCYCYLLYGSIRFAETQESVILLPQNTVRNARTC